MQSIKMHHSRVKTKESIEVNSKGFGILLKSWLPINSPVKALMRFCHGYGDTCTFLFEGIAKKLAASGYAIFYPSYGLSDGLHGYIPSFDSLVDDVIIEHFSKVKGDCHNSKGEKGMCVVGAINNYTDQLRGYGDSSNHYNLTESLMFLSHFVGDIHQPLHAGFEADEGGNTIIVHWYRRKTNLHHVWDTSIIETAMRDYYDNDLDTMVEGIRFNITGGWADEVDSWEKCQNKITTCANDYAIESIHLDCNYAYKDVEQDSTLGDEYFFTRLPIVKKRIAQAGLRLASILNLVFDGENKQEIQSY